MHFLTRVFHPHRSVEPAPERQIMRVLQRVVVLCSDAEQASLIQARDAAPTLYRSGVGWASDSRYRLQDGRMVEFLSARGSIWWRRLAQPNSITYVVPLYRRDQTLDPDLRERIESHLRRLPSVTVVDGLDFA